MSDLKIFSSDISVSGKRVIVRLDLNVPINNSKIDDDTRIKLKLFCYHTLEDQREKWFQGCH